MINNNERSFATEKEQSPASSFLISPEQPQSIPQLIQAPIQVLPPGRHPIRLIACGIPQGVNGIVHQLHVLGFAEVTLWSPPLPSPVRGEILRILTRYVRIEG
jgi:hypothetical protein